MPQHLIFTLDGITAGDYLAWVRDPEPPALGNALRSIAVHADALGDLIEVDLVWEGAAPAPHEAAVAAGFALTPEVDAVRAFERVERLAA